MGFALACAIAQATTWQLLNFERRSSVFTCIDNVAFSGPLPQVHHDVCRFLKRCHDASVTLNDHTASTISEFLSSTEESQIATIREWHKDSFVFLGVQYQWTTARKALAAKTIDKLTAARCCLLAIDDLILPRQLAAILGLLRHANQVLSLAGYARFETTAWTARVAALLQRDLSLWDSVAIRFPAAHKASLLSWFDEVLTPRESPLYRPLPNELPPTLIVDASAVGWGAIFFDGTTTRHTSGKWATTILSSVTAEPEGVWEAANALLPPDVPRAQVVTDHLPLVFASRSLFPRTAPYNQLFLRLQTAFPSTRFVYSHVAGANNPTDSLSRVGTIDSETLERVRNIAGGWSCALATPESKPCALCSTCLPWQC